jgi:hypothetical protein
MQSPIETYEQLKRIDNIYDLAYERLFENYLKYELKGSQKLIDIESTDQESVINKLTAGRPIPGMIYTFIHVNENNMIQIQNLATGKLIEFHDFTPIVFCTRYDPLKNIIKGLNLTMLPSSERLKFFQAYFDNYKNFFDRIEEKTEYNKLAANIAYIIISISGKNPELFKKFNNDQNALFNYAYRSYNLKNAAKFRMLEYEEWRFIPFYDARQSFKKINIAEIHKTYWNNKNKTK